MNKPLVIVVADEEPDIRSLLCAFLTPHGYQVLSAKDGEDVLQFLKSQKVDLVIADIHTPKLGGPQLYEAACKLHPGLHGRFVFTGPISGSEPPLYEGNPVLAKPFQFDKLLSTVQKLTEKKTNTTAQ